MGCFFEKGLHFSCTRCSHCCCGEPGYVFLSRDDLTKLCIWFKFTEPLFIEKYCRTVPWYDGKKVLCLKEKDNFECILWDNGCSAYDARPVQCATYPFWKRLIADQKNWNAEKRNCPGIGSGRLWSKEEILDQMQRNALNHPVYLI